MESSSKRRRIMGQQLNEFEVLITFGKTGKEIISVKLYETFGDVDTATKN